MSLVSNDTVSTTDVTPRQMVRIDGRECIVGQDLEGVQGKLKLPLCLSKYHAMKTYYLLNLTSRHEVWGSGGIAPRVLNLGAKWRRVVSFTLRSSYRQGKDPLCPLDTGLGGGWARKPVWMRRRRKRNFLQLSGIELLVVQSVVQSLY
jgi:hypothetical protein